MSEISSRYYKLIDEVSLSGISDIIGVSENCEYIVCSIDVSPYVVVYKRNGDAFSKMPDINPVPESQVWGASISNDGVYLSFVYSKMDVTITIGDPEDENEFQGDIETAVVYKRSGDVYSLTDTLYPFTPIETLDDVDSIINRCVLSGDGKYICLTRQDNSAQIFRRDNDKYAPLMALNNFFNEASFSYDGTYLACVSQSGAMSQIYKLSGNAYILTNSFNDIPYFTRNCEMSQDGNYLIMSSPFAYGASWPRMALYSRSGDTFSRMPNPTSLTDMGISDYDSEKFISGHSFSGDASILAVTLSFEPYLKLFELDKGVFKDAKLLKQIEGHLQSCKLSPDGKYMVRRFSQSPDIMIFKKDK